MKCFEEPFSIMYTKQGTGIFSHFLAKKGSKAQVQVVLCKFTSSKPRIVGEDTGWKSYAFTSFLDSQETLICLTNYKTFQITDLGEKKRNKNK